MIVPNPLYTPKGLLIGPSNSPLLRKCEICGEEFRHNNRLIKHMKKYIVSGLLAENIVIDGLKTTIVGADI